MEELPVLIFFKLKVNISDGFRVNEENKKDMK
jgi:hypothetical protein